MLSGWKYQFEWRIALLTAMLFPVLLSLGFWQMHRADQNRELIALAKLQRERAPLLFEQLPLKELERNVAAGQLDQWHLKQVRLQGQWLQEYFLVENQMHNGKNGYFVVGFMKLTNGSQVLVNRGWIAAPALRSELPAVQPPSAGALEHGELYLMKSLFSSEPVFAETGWPRRVGRMNIPGLAQEVGVSVLPVLVRLREKSASALTADWPVVNIAPEKNIAYAIQWFAMAAALIVCYLALSFRSEPTTENKVTE